MDEGGFELDCRQVIAVAEEEASAVDAGDLNRYLAILVDDAVFIRQTRCPRSARNYGNGCATPWSNARNGSWNHRSHLECARTAGGGLILLGCFPVWQRPSSDGPAQRGRAFLLVRA